jgi:hypothetical protein
MEDTDYFDSCYFYPVGTEHCCQKYGVARQATEFGMKIMQL